MPSKTRLRLRLHSIGYVQIRLESDPLWYGPLCLHGTGSNWNGIVLYGITFVSGPIWYQIADPLCTGSTRSRVSTTLVRANFAPVPNGSSPV